MGCASLIQAQKPGTVTDPRDGQTYKTVEIGGKVWLAQNFSYFSRGSWCYQNEDENCKKYGRMYSWDAIMNKQTKDKSQGICMKGWHVPSLSDWHALMGEYKKTKDELVGGSSGLNLTLSGYKNDKGAYDFLDKVAAYWSSTPDSTDSQKAWSLNGFSDEKSKPLTDFSTSKMYGQYLRCVRD